MRKQFESYNSSGSLVILDEVDQLRLINYRDEIPEHEEDKYRGLVVDTVDRIVCSSHPYTDEKPLSEFTYDPLVETMRAYEGTIIRLFCVPTHTIVDTINQEDGKVTSEIIKKQTNNWYFSTYKKIDGRRSRWGPGRTFYEMFTELFPQENWNEIDPEYAYTFLLCHNENKMCYTHEKNRLILTVKWNLTLQRHESACDDTPLSYYELPEYADSDTQPSQVGFLVNRYTDTGLESTKYVSDEYVYDRNVRGNEPNLRMAYYGSSDRTRFRELLSSSIDTLDEYERQFVMLTEFVYDEYYRRFVRHEQCTYPPAFYSILKQIRVVYGREFENLDTVEQRDIVNRTVGKYNARVLNTCIKYMLEQ